MKSGMICAVLAASAAFFADAALKTTWDVGDYVQDGLVMHYDGIRNVGATAEHDSSATQWKDLSPNAGYAENRACVYGGNGSWADNAYVFTGVSCMETKNQLALGGEFTIQIACDVDVTSDDRTHPSVFAAGSFYMYVDRSYAAQQALTNIFWSTETYSGNTSGNKPQVKWPEGRYINAAFDASYMYITPGTDWDVCAKNWGMRQSRPTPVDVPELSYTIGGRPMGGTSGGRNYCSIGKVYAVRAYSRKFENWELAHNRAIDEIRFHGATAIPYTNVLVAASDNAVLVGAEAPGGYAVDGSHTFTASAVTDGENHYEVSGYTLEEWDEENGVWGAVTAHDGSSYTYATNTTTGMVRLMWRWRQTNGIRRYDVYDYVTNGILAHYDGIRNVGPDFPHDSSAAKWIDISDRRIPATPGLTVWGGNYGSWISNAYSFVGQSYLKTDESITLGGEFTIQIAADMDLTIYENVSNSPSLLSADNNFSMYTDRYWDTGRITTNLYWNVDSFGGSERPTMSNWPEGRWSTGRYVSGAFTSTNLYITQTDQWRGGWGYKRTRTIMNDVKAMRFLIGGQSNKNGMIGPYYSLRMYSHMLSNDELAKNRDVDEVRFHGAEATAPDAVQVASSTSFLSGRESGAYKLVGSYTFTAEGATVDGVEYVPRGSVVETWDSSSRTWTNPEFASGASRTLSAGAAARRLTWRWGRNQGLILLLR